MTALGVNSLKFIVIRVVYIHLTKFLIGHFSNSFFRPNVNNIEMNCCLDMCSLMDNS